MSRRYTASLVLGLVFLAITSVQAKVDVRQAWDALQQLDIPRAVELFEAARKEKPKDHSLIRGLLLAYYLDGRATEQLDLMREAITLEPGNAYNLALFEHLAAEFMVDARMEPMQKAFAESLIGLPPGPMAFCGRKMLRNYLRSTFDTSITDWRLPESFPPGIWISGPYENGSLVSAVRPLPQESDPLDTTVVLNGLDGVLVPWIYLEHGPYGEFNPGTVMEDVAPGAIQMRVPFRLGSARDMIVVLGGEFHYRIRIDGKEVAEDRRLGNAVIRDAQRISLDKGDHELTLVAGWGDRIADFTIQLVDTDYNPIDGLIWLRYTSPSGSRPEPAVRVNPIFDPFEAYVKKHGEAPDTRYWRAVLYMYNARLADAVSMLEDADRNGGITPLERYRLYGALNANDEAEQAAVQLSRLHETTSSPMIDMLWMHASGDDNATNIRKAVELSQKYPDRPILEGMATAAPILDGDMGGFLQNAKNYMEKYPDQLFMPAMLLGLYQGALEDYDGALAIFEDMCRRNGQRRLELTEGPDLYVKARQFDKGVALAREAMELMPGYDNAVREFVRAATSAGKPELALQVLDSLIALHPTNIDLLSLAYTLCTRTDQHERALHVLEDIHALKPTAWMPLIKIDSLHNNAPYDSIFTTVDVTSLWGDPPAEELLNGEGEYTIVDRRQVIIFNSGAAYSDIQKAWVVLDRSAVENYQEMNIGFPPSSESADLRVARRLRKGYPPVEGKHEGTSIYFQDLQPGDAIELRYRIWESGSGDLWRHYWDEYQARAGKFQQVWEYSVLTNRNDCHFASNALDITPVVDTHFNYVRTTWRGENSPAVDYSSSLRPPHDDLMGKIFVSTLSDWQELGDWYAGISEAALNDNPRATQLADRLIDGAATDREKLRRLYDYVVFNIPYQVMDFNYSASVPHPPDEVLVSLWGDCKDKGHLLIAMLREAGITAWPTLVMTRPNGSQLPIPFMGYDHLIAGCIIDGDTLYVDPTAEACPPDHSLGLVEGDQPCLNVLPDGKSFPGRLPGFTSKDLWEDWTLTLAPSRENGEYRFSISREFGNQSAGSWRYSYRDDSMAEMKKVKESYYSDEWGAPVTVDSVARDSIDSTAPIFKDSFSGAIDLPTQQIGNTALIQLPKWGPFRNSLPTDIVGQGRRDYPADLRYLCGEYRYVLKFEVPEGYGEPQVPEPAHLKESRYSFDYDHTYDADKRELTLTYRVSVEDGQVPVDGIVSFLKTVIETFSSPILLQRKI